jgi:hypothetical protein
VIVFQPALSLTLKGNAAALLRTPVIIAGLYRGGKRKYACRSGGIRDLIGSPDHLIRPEQERRGNGEAERLGGLEVDEQLEFRGPLHR